MTEQERIQTATKIYHSLKNIVTSLYGRWLDEQEYESIAEYGKVFEREITPFGATFIKASKKPFGFTYTLGGATYQITCNSKAYGYKRIA